MMVSTTSLMKAKKMTATFSMLQLLVRLLVFFVCLTNAAAAAAADDDGADTCAANKQALYCPNCGGMNVTDCLTQCDGYPQNDLRHSMCFRRQLFSAHDTSGNPDTHYRFLWNDIVAAVVWFFAAGLATACGVGGGGIYVPLGIFLLQFAPKAASGLSQASIFGASLGGLLINIRSRHPNKKIRNLPCERDEDGHVILPACPQEKSEFHQHESDDVEGGGGGLSRSISSGMRYYTRPLIDYNMAMFLAPMEMAGAVMGVLIQKVMPNWLYLIIASVILGFTSYKTYKKFFDTRKKEIKERKKQQQEEEEEEQQQQQQQQEENNNEKSGHDDGTGGAKEEAAMDQPTAQADSGGSAVDESTAAKAEAEEQADPTATQENGDVEEAVNEGVTTTTEEGSSQPKTKQQEGAEQELDEEEKRLLRAQYLEEDARQYPGDQLAALFTLWVGLALITFLKGGKGVESIVGITCESPWYAVLIVLQFVWLLGFGLFYAFHLLKRQALKDAVQYPYQPHDVLWDRKKCRFFGIMTFVAGIVAGLIGVGGGMVLGPLMLIMGVHPRVSTATTATMIVLTSSSVAIMYVAGGIVPWSYAIFFFAVCLVGAFVGKKYIDGYVKKTGRASILIFILASVIALATVGFLVIALTGLAKNNWCFDGFQEFCPAGTKDGATCPVVRRLLDAVTGFHMSELTQ